MSTPLSTQFIYLFEWLGFLLILQLSVWHPLRNVSRTFALPLSFPVSLLASTLVTWYIATIGLPVFLLFIPIILLLGYTITKKSISFRDIQKCGKWYLIFYGTFILSLIAKILYNPAIDISYEKFMDSMILSSMIVSPSLPPSDAWFAGGSLTWYYYLGAWMFAVPAHILSIPAPVMYNLVIPTVFAASAVMIYSGSSLLMTRFRFIPLLLLIVSYPGFFTLIPVAWSDNTPFRFILDGTTRLIPGAVTENPLSALLIGSPRPYAIALMIQCLILFCLIFIFVKWKDMDLKARIGLGLILALSLGTLIPLHTWDFIIYLPITVFLGLLTSYRMFVVSQDPDYQRPRLFLHDIYTLTCHSRRYVSDIRGIIDSGSGSSLLIITFFTPVLALLVYLPFLFEMDNKRMQGLTPFIHASDPIPFILVHGFFILILLLYLWRDIIQRPVILVIPLIVTLSGFIATALIIAPALYLLFRRFEKIEEVIAFFGLICILFCELFAIVQNGVPDPQNTTYKFYFAAWLLLGFSTFAIIGEVLGRSRLFNTPLRYYLISVIVLCMALFFPVTLLSGGPVWSPSLDGTDFVKTYVGIDESDALDYIRSLPPGQVLVEGVVPLAYDQDNSEKYFSRVSAYTGIQAVMGSYSRESVFRGEAVTRERGEDSILMYAKPELANSLMAKHNATLLYVGLPEIQLYQMKNPDIYSRYGFSPIFRQNQTTIWRIT